jgi:glycosyltransferase involved in cell wall biosynthesis
LYHCFACTEINLMGNKSLERDDTDPPQQMAPPLNLEDFNIVIVIPAYNEERFIGSIVLLARQYSRHVIVVDDGSADATAELARLAGAQVIRHPENRGKGAALNTALQAAHLHNPDVVVMLDADGQHSLEELMRVVAPVLSGDADLVIGSRYIGDSSQTPRHRIWGHWVFNWITRLASGVPASDSQSGYRAFSPQVLPVISFQSSGFSVESEMQFIVNQYGLRLVEVPITVQYQDKPKRNVFSHGIMVLNGVLRLAGQYRPLLFFGVPGAIVLAAGLIWGWVVVDIYSRKLQLAVGYAMISVLLTILGCLMLSTGFILHSVRGLLMDMRDQVGKR